MLLPRRSCGAKDESGSFTYDGVRAKGCHDPIVLIKSLTVCGVLYTLVLQLQSKKCSLLVIEPDGVKACVPLSLLTLLAYVNVYNKE